MGQIRGAYPSKSGEGSLSLRKGRVRGGQQHDTTPGPVKHIPVEQYLKEKGQKPMEQMSEQMIPCQRTVGELMDILQQYPRETPLLGHKGDRITVLCTVQGNCPDGVLDNVMICFWNKEDIEWIQQG